VKVPVPGGTVLVVAVTFSVFTLLLSGLPGALDLGDGAQPAGASPGHSSVRSCDEARVLASWSVARRAAQLVVVPAEETDVDQVSASVRAGAGGIILFGDEAPAGLGESLHHLELSAPGGVRPEVMTDEEGGEVQRMPDLVGSLPWPRTMAATMSPGEVEQLARRTAQRMAANGVTMDLAPVLDLASGPGPDAQHTDGPRSFSLDPSVATTFGLAFAHGLEQGGVVPVVKHFPGEGQATANTDDAPASTPPLSELEHADLLPFEASVRAHLPAVMVGNASVPGLTGSPASLSSDVITGLLRERLGFTGLVMTDSLSADAISDRGLGVPQAAEEAILAGADMVLYDAVDPDTVFDQVVQRLVSAVDERRLSTDRLDAAVEHVLEVKHVDLCRRGG
jgi:beta-N-acetylhexosaminidase